MCDFINTEVVAFITSESLEPLIIIKGYSYTTEEIDDGASPLRDQVGVAVVSEGEECDVRGTENVREDTQKEVELTPLHQNKIANL